MISNRDTLQSLGEMEVHLPVLRGVEIEGVVQQLLVCCIGVEGAEGRWHPRTSGTAASDDACLHTSCNSSRSRELADRVLQPQEVRHHMTEQADAL